MADSTPQDLDLTPEIINIEVQFGTDNTITFQLTDEDGVGVDITLDSVKFTAKDELGGDVMIATKTNTVGQHTTPLTGETTFVLTKNNLTHASPQDQVIWKYEIRRVFAGNLREVIYIHGDLVIQPSVGLDA
jgi:hypothetical protein